MRLLAPIALTWKWSCGFRVYSLYVGMIPVGFLMWEAGRTYKNVDKLRINV